MREEQGEMRLYNHGYVFRDAAELSTIGSGARLQIGSAGENEGGRLGFSGKAGFEFTGPGRVVVFSGELEVAYDSLTSPEREAAVEEGWYLLFIGEPGAELTVTAPGDLG